MKAHMHKAYGNVHISKYIDDVRRFLAIFDLLTYLPTSDFDKATDIMTSYFD